MLGAFCLVGGLAPRVTHRLLRYGTDRDGALPRRTEGFELVALMVVAVALAGVAAFVETRLTLPIAERVSGREFPGPG